VTLDELPEWARELVVSSPVARLGLVDELDRPRVLPVTFALFEDALWSAIDWKPKRSAEPARVRRLRRRPAASLLVDVYSADWSRLEWVELSGRMSILDADDAGDAVEALAAKYPQYRTNPPAGPMLRLAPERFACWRAS
jgi:PPOX class probable F420-dependent enzyme